MRIHYLSDKRPEALTQSEAREARELEAAFVRDYKALCAKHGLEVVAKLELSPDGLRPVASIVPFRPVSEEP